MSYNYLFKYIIISTDNDELQLINTDKVIRVVKRSAELCEGNVHAIKVVFDVINNHLNDQQIFLERPSNIEIASPQSLFFTISPFSAFAKS